MPKRTNKTKKTEWEGFSFPARILTDTEREILTPLCVRCGLPGAVVEVQSPFSTKKERTQPLIDFAEKALKFYCGYHAPVDVPQEIRRGDDEAFFKRVTGQVYCPKHLYMHHVCNCIRHDEPCLSKCTAIQAIIGDLPFPLVRERTERSYQRHLERKKHEKTIQPE